MTLLMKYNVKEFINFIKELRTNYNTLPLGAYMTKCYHKYLFMLLESKKKEDIMNYLNAVNDFSILNMYWRYAPDRFTYYIPLTYIMDQPEKTLDEIGRAHV